MDLKVVVITGASSGIGAAIATHFVQVGYRKLVLVARREARLQEVQADCRKIANDGLEILLLKLDLSLIENNSKLVEETIKKFGRLDILINNCAKLGNFATYEGQSVDGFHSLMMTNLVGPFALTKAAMPHIENAKGNVLFVASMFGTTPQKGHIAYNTSKAALKMLAKIFALETVDKGVCVNILSPGFIDTEIFDHMICDDDTRAAFRADMVYRTPMARIGQSLEMAKLTAFIVSDDNSFMTGSDIISDGGFLLTSKTRDNSESS